MFCCLFQKGGGPVIDKNTTANLGHYALAV
nr:MAG TPA: hypothetical protein [Caudoviricetes sp.]